jgi:hypothetical protein
MGSMTLIAVVPIVLAGIVGLWIGGLLYRFVRFVPELMAFVVRLWRSRGAL